MRPGDREHPQRQGAVDQARPVMPAVDSITGVIFFASAS
jgi:hypothetical protein